MKATAILRQEHEAILRMLAAAEETARQIEGGQQVRPGRVDGFVEFFQIFADQCHHAKEEGHLFPAMIRRGFPSKGGPIAVMLFEHEQGRELTRRMHAAAGSLTAGVPGAGLEWAAAAREYADLLRAHIAKENDILFVMAERVLTDEEQSELAKCFDAIETEKIGAGTHERLHSSMSALIAEASAAPLAI